MNASGNRTADHLSARRLSRRRALADLWGATAGIAAGGVLRPAVELLAGEPRSPRGELAAEIDRMLWQLELPAWYPRSVDTRQGGFWESFAQDWTRRPATTKFLVYQARMTWVPAAAALADPERGKPYLEHARHGLRFLQRMWDRQHGGFFDRTDLAGQPDRRMPWKQMYSLAFGLFAAAAVWEATGDAAAGQLARDAFGWIERHAHDPQHGGYYEHLNADGQPVAIDIPGRRSREPSGAAEVPVPQLGQGLPVIGQIGHKSMNAHIHVLEALIALRRVWEDPQLAARLEEVFLIVRDRIVRPGGHLAMFCARDFTAVDERSSFGHELETAYLLIEAAELLEREDDEVTRRVALELVEHSLRWGWDRQHGGFYDEGPPTGRATRRDKVWWVQVEAMNGLLTADVLAGRSQPRYFEVFADTWRFFRDRMSDSLRGGCDEVVAEDGQPLQDRRQKATPWKTAYHVTRALMLATDRLEEETT